MEHNPPNEIQPYEYKLFAYVTPERKARPISEDEIAEKSDYLIKITNDGLPKEARDTQYWESGYYVGLPNPRARDPEFEIRVLNRNLNLFVRAGMSLRSIAYYLYTTGYDIPGITPNKLDL